MYFVLLLVALLQLALVRAKVPSFTIQSTTYQTPDSTSLELLIAQPRTPPSPRKPTLLFLHGFAHSARQWAQYVLPYFAARGYRCLAPSYRGHGASEGGDDPVQTEAQVAADLAGLVDTDTVVIGHSMGGNIASQLVLGGSVGNNLKGVVLLTTNVDFLGRGVQVFLQNLQQQHQDIYELVLPVLLNTASVDESLILKVFLNSDKFSTECERKEIIKQLYSNLIYKPIDITSSNTSSVCGQVPCLFVGAREDDIAYIEDIEPYSYEVGGDYLLVEGAHCSPLVEKEGVEDSMKEVLKWIKKLP